MALEETVGSLDGISEEYHDLYVPTEDGKFKIDITGLKSAVQKERNLRKQIEKQSKKAADETPDVEEIKTELVKAQNIIKDMKIGGKIKDAALAAGVHQDYVDDVMTLTKGNFSLDEDGNVMCVGADGQPSGVDVDKFFGTKFKSTKPIYYVNTGRKGGGAQGGLDGGGPLSLEGKVTKAIQNKNTTDLVNLKMSKIKK